MIGRRAVIGGFLGGLTALSSACAPGEPPIGSVSPSPSPTPSQVWMPAEYADHYDLVVPRGWKVSRWDQYRAATFWVRKIEDVNPPAGFAVENWLGEEVGVRFRSDRLDSASWEEVRNAQRDYFSGPQSRDLELLPDRKIGGERAAGMRVLRVGRENAFVWEQWHVLRHDGVWLFDLFSGGGRDRVGDDVYELLDSFRWTGPAPSPIPEPLPVPTPRQR